MYIFGGELVTSGVVSNELWAFNLTSFEWQVLLPSNMTTSSYLPLAVRHHTAHVVDDRMLIIWGFAGNRENVLTRLVQQYDFRMFECTCEGGVVTLWCIHLYAHVRVCLHACVYRCGRVCVGVGVSVCLWVSRYEDVSDYMG